MDGVADFQSVLGDLRAELDALDTRLVVLLKERADVIRRVIRQKTQYGLGPVDREREKQMLSRIEEQAASVGLEPQIASQILSAVIEAFTAIEAKTLGSGARTVSSTAQEPPQVL